MRMNRKLFLLQGMIVLFLAVGTGAAALLCFIGVLGIAMGITSAQVPLLSFALFCLIEVLFVSVCAWRGLTAAFRLAEYLADSPHNRHAILPCLQRASRCCLLAGCAWALLIAVLTLISGRSLANVSILAAYLLPAPCLWLLALGLYSPAAALMRTLPLTPAPRLSLFHTRILTVLCALLLAAVGLWSGIASQLKGWELTISAVFALACILIALHAWQGKFLLLRAAGWCFVLCSAGLAVQYFAARISWGNLLTLGWMEAMAMLALMLFPAAVGLGISVLADCISLRGDECDSHRS